MMYTFNYMEPSENLQADTYSPDLFYRGSIWEALTTLLPPGSEEETQTAEDDLTTFVKSNKNFQLLEPHIRSLLERDLENDYICYGLTFDEINWKMVSKVLKF